MSYIYMDDIGMGQDEEGVVTQPTAPAPEPAVAAQEATQPLWVRLLICGASVAAAAGAWWAVRQYSQGMGGARMNPDDDDVDYWVKDVETRWGAPAGLFVHGTAPQIAREVLEAHEWGLSPSVSALTYFINRAGRGMSAGMRAKVESARRLVQRHGLSVEDERSMGRAEIADRKRRGRSVMPRFGGSEQQRRARAAAN